MVLKKQVLKLGFILLVVVGLIPVPRAEPAANGVFLIAKQNLQDPSFRQTVVLVTQLDSGGTLGVIVNRPTQLSWSEVFPDIPALQDHVEPVYFGGPVLRMNAVFLYRGKNPPEHTVPVLKDVYFGASAKTLNQLLKEPDPTQHVRIYVGHSGWAPGQLAMEIAQGGWYIMPADADVVFDMAPEKIWPEFIKRATSRTVENQTPVIHAAHLR